MKSSVDDIALQGIEFWSTVCDEEADLAIEAAEVGYVYLPAGQHMHTPSPPPPRLRSRGVCQRA